MLGRLIEIVVGALLWAVTFSRAADRGNHPNRGRGEPRTWWPCRRALVAQSDRLLHPLWAGVLGVGWIILGFIILVTIGQANPW